MGTFACRAIWRSWHLLAQSRQTRCLGALRTGVLISLYKGTTETLPLAYHNIPLPGKQFIDHLFSKLREMKCSRRRFIVQGCCLVCNPGGNKQRSLPAILPALLRAGLD